MSSNLKVNTILPSTGTNIGIGTAGGTVTIVGDVDIADKIVHTGDTNTSIRFPAADTITAETGGSERLRITSGGKVNIGGDFSASTYGLQVYGSGGTNSATLGIKNNVSGPAGIHLLSGHGNWSIFNSWSVGDALEFRDEGANSTRMIIDSSGRLLLGTTTEGVANASKFTIADTAHCGMTIRSGTLHDGQIAFSDGTSGDDEFRGQIRYHHADNYLALVTDATERLRITSGGDTELRNNVAGINDSYSQYLKFRTTQSNGQSAITGAIRAQGRSGWGGDLVFYSKPANGSPNDTVTEKVRITSAGELGVNTTAPVEKLGISGNMRFVNPTGTTSRITALPSGSYNTGTTGGSAICFQRIADGGGGSDEIFFETHWQGNRHGESMRINKYGHVLKPNQPSFNVTIGGGQINSNVGVIVFTDTTTLANHNTGNHYNTSNGRFTAPVAGRYQINARMLTNSSTQAYTIYLLRVNGNHHGYIGHNHSDFWFMESGSWVLNLAANDYVDCYLQLHSGHGGFNYASFSGFLIG